MKRVEEDGMWSLMCPHICPGLSDCWGEKFEELYTRYETEGKFMKQVRLLFGMVTSSHWIILPRNLLRYFIANLKIFLFPDQSSATLVCHH